MTKSHKYGSLYETRQIINRITIFLNLFHTASTLMNSSSPVQTVSVNNVLLELIPQDSHDSQLKNRSEGKK
jgi:hypothetical protein